MGFQFQSQLYLRIYLAPNADDLQTWVASMQHIAKEGRCFVISTNQFCRVSRAIYKCPCGRRDLNERMGIRYGTFRPTTHRLVVIATPTVTSGNLTIFSVTEIRAS
jgi:hypothetical protein